MLISEDYRSLNEQLHKDNTHYGTSGHKYAHIVMEFAMAMGTRDILDYGCGKGTLSRNLPFPIHEYDPCIEGKNERPDPADVVVCTDVMEHIEPDLLDNVLDDIRSLTKRGVILTIATGPAQKTLSDGRNAHLIQEDIKWWLPKIWDRFKVISVNNGPTITVVGC